MVPSEVNTCVGSSESSRPEELQQPEHEHAGGAGQQVLLHGGGPQVLPLRDPADHHRPHRYG